SNGGLADIAPPASPVLADQRLEAFQLVDAHQVKELLPRETEVLAQPVADGMAEPLQLGIHDLLCQRAAPAAARRALGAFLQRTQAGATAPYGVADLRLGNAIARADQRRPRQQVDAE